MADRIPVEAVNNYKYIVTFWIFTMTMNTRDIKTWECAVVGIIAGAGLAGFIFGLLALACYIR